MLKHYFKIAIRNLYKNKGISFINIFGLAVGMTCAILIFLWVGQQLSYDQWQVNKDRIYRLESEDWVIQPPYLRETTIAFPEVEAASRFFFWWEPTLSYEQNIVTAQNLAIVDTSVFRIFNFEWLAGDKRTALKEPYSIVINETTAQKLFPNDNPMWKVIKLSNKYDFKITGIIKDVDRLQFDVGAFITTNDMVRINGNDEFITARYHNHDIYVLVKPNVNVDNLVSKINNRAATLDQYKGAKLLLRPFTDIYFTQNLPHEAKTKHGNFNIVIVFSIIAVLILGIACINFVNLTIAKTSTREKEIAVRKVAGAKQKSIQLQFFGETFTIVFSAFLISILLVGLLLLRFGNLTSENIAISSLGGESVLIIIGVLLFTSLVSGAYPSLYLSVLQPVLILKGKSPKGKRNSLLSRVLISFQFTISIFLVIAVLTVFEQLHFLQTTDLGINTEQVITCSLRGPRFSGDNEKVISAKEAFTNRLKSNPNIIGATYVNQLPGNISNTWRIYNHDEEKSIEIRVMFIDPAFMDLMGIKLLEGTNYSYDRPSEINAGYILNEEAVKQIGLTNPTGSYINGGQVPVYGVVKDFHFNSLYNKIGPFGFRFDVWPRNALIKVTGNDMAATISYIEEVYKEFCPGNNFEYNFLDEVFAREYKTDQQLQEILSYFVFLAIMLSCLGLLALTALAAQQRVKEIGIRKVLGSTNSGIIKLISQSFLKWILISNLIAWPVAYFVLQNWLETFAYRIDQNFTIYFAGAMLSLAIALITITTQAYKAAVANPVNSLRNE